MIRQRKIRAVQVVAPDLSLIRLISPRRKMHIETPIAKRKRADRDEEVF